MKIKKFAVIGDPIAHSFSPAMHNAAFRELGISAQYRTIRVQNQTDELQAFANQARAELAGFNVTAPHKQKIPAFLNHLSPISMMTGSVNTVIVADQEMTGTSTDGIGFQKAVEEAFGFALRDARITIFGAGGAAKAIAFHALSAGAKQLTVFNRSEQNAKQLTDLLSLNYPSANVQHGLLADSDALALALEQSDLAVQCTSLGLRIDDPMPVVPDVFPGHISFFEANYRDTQLLRVLHDRGNPVANGLGMLLYQGVEAFRCWFPDLQPPVEIMRNALLEQICKTHRN